MKLQQLTGAIGARITGADIRNAEDVAAIRQAFIDHAVVTVAGQDAVSPDDHIAFAEAFGTINVNRFFKAVESHPKVAEVLKEPDQKAAIGEDWHTDHSYDSEPAMCSILRAIELPPHGGDTCFVSMYAAYDALSDRFKEMLDGMHAWHSSRHAFGAASADHESTKTGRIGNADKATQDTRHPIVITHPLSGRKALYVNPGFTIGIDGMTSAEGDAILQFLYAHCKNPDFQCRVSWQQGDLTMWDNRATWHKAVNDYHGYRRYMHRITVEGCALTA